MSNEASHSPTPRIQSLGGPSSSSSPSTSPRPRVGSTSSPPLHSITSAGLSTSASLPPGEGSNGEGSAAAAEEANAEENTERSRRVTAAARRAVIVQTKLKFLADFIRAMDMVVYYYFSYMYFLDNSFFRFFIRCAIQLNFLTPKPIHLPTPPQRRSVIIGLFGWTLVNLLIHIFTAAPEAGEATGGYLHGGLIIDFIGQEGPVSKFRLATMDVTILLLQLIMLATAIEKQGLLDKQTAARKRAAGGGAAAQDLDSEERGEIRQEADSDETATSTSEEEESDTDDSGREDAGALDGSSRRSRRSTIGSSTSDINDRQSAPSHRRGRQRSTSVTSRRTNIGTEHEPGGSGRGVDDDGGRYAQYSGQLVVAELSLVDAVRWQWNHGSPGSGNGGAISTVTGRERRRRRRRRRRRSARRGRGATGGSAAVREEGAASRGIEALSQLSRMGR
ncbi:hypothetical protein BDZ91DRAFT_720549 [Kalaharituber pfeilii]|nr:hypothetical protein BDZ91DRAFT_720549 [Kalaharituber pfeilii]